MSKGNKGMGGLGTNCPHCEQRALLRRSTIMGRLVREKVYRCSNDECGFVFVAIEEIQRTVVPPRTPHPDVTLPLGKISGHLDKATP